MTDTDGDRERKRWRVTTGTLEDKTIKEKEGDDRTLALRWSPGSSPRCPEAMATAGELGLNRH